MSPEQWLKIEEVFQTALDLSPAKREHFLFETEKADSNLAAEVRKLLKDYESAENFIESPVWTDSRFLNSSAKKIISDSFDEEDSDNSSKNDFFIGKQIGAYKIINEIGRGGMGAVFVAERADGEFFQKVAIKLIKRGMDSDFIIRRFRHERQILASFEHPFIGRLLDGGTTAEGLPYFVMEYIEGETVYNYCDKKRLNISERLKIFQKICAAVSYAHERQIIHRDIKPSNILVAENGVPKLLDFGIAKVLDPNLLHESVNPTASMMRLMTPDYASPEQVRGLEVTPASDIYSLGVLLYELLTGHRPYNFAGRALHEVTQVICEILPEVPSKILDVKENLLTQYVESDEIFAVFRGTSKIKLKAELENDLDNIVMKSLLKEPSERYFSVKEFSEDISRHLQGQTVTAQPFLNQNKYNEDNNYPKTSLKSLAVLPFKFLNLVSSEDTGDKFLGVGLADALITRLSKIRRFVVRPTSSILPFGENSADIIQAGKELNVDFILDGSIKKANDRLRITVQLLNVQENSTIWATSIDETITDFFSLEDAISNKVIDVLLPQLTGNEREEIGKRGTKNPDAFEQYLRGRYYFNTFSEDAFAKAFLSFHKAIAADPNYAHAYTGIADYYNWLGIFGVLPPKECFEAAIEAAKKAVELDPNLAEAHASLGFSLHAGNYDWAKGEHHLIRALELSPNYTNSYVWYSIVLYTEGRFNEGLAIAQKAVEIDPLTPFNHHNVAWGFYFARRFEEGKTRYLQMIKNFPNYGLGYYCLSKILRITGNTSEALKQSRKAVEVFGGSVFSLISEAESLAANGDVCEAKEKLQYLEELALERYVSPYQIALVYCYLKDKHNALKYLQKALEIKEAWLNWMGVEPVFDIIREEEKFKEILEKVGYDVFFNNFSASKFNFAPKTALLSADEEAITTATQRDNLHNNPTLFIEETQRTNDGTIIESRKINIFGRKWLAISASLVVLLIIFGVIRFSFKINENSNQAINKTSFQNSSILVLPFQTSDNFNENLGIGLSDALTGKLGYIKKFTVISANTGRSLAKEDIQKIRSKIGSVFIVRGELQKINGQISIDAELINSVDEQILWKEKINAEEHNLFEIQTILAKKIWTTLGVEPLPLENQQINKSYTNNSLAYELYLVGRYQMTNRTPENLKKAIASFTRASQEDNNFALAYVGIADAFSLLNLYDINAPVDGYTKARENAIKALTIDDNLAEAHVSLAYVKFYKDRDRAGGELEFRRAIQANPSYAQAHHWFSLALTIMDRPLDAISEGQIAQQLDPSSLAIKVATGMAFFYDNKFDEALAECNKALAIDTGFVPAHKVKRWIYMVQKNYPEALAAFQKERSYSGGSDSDAGWNVVKWQVESLNGNHDKILPQLDTIVSSKVVQDNPQGYGYEIAVAYSLLNQKEKAIEWLEKSEAAQSHTFNFIGVDQRFDVYRNDPRFIKLTNIFK